MSAQLLETTSIGPASRYVQVKQEASLAAHTEELAALRFSIILTAKWEASAGIDEERRNELRRELDGLRRALFEGDRRDRHELRRPKCNQGQGNG